MKHHRSKPTRIELRAKEIRRLYQEERKLCDEQRNAPPIKLEEPYIRGFERFFVLTPKASRRADAEKLTTVLQYFQHYEFCRRGWFRGSFTDQKRWAKGEIGPHFPCRPQLFRLIKKSFPKDLYFYVKSKSVDLKNGLPPLRQLNKNQLHERVRFRFPDLLESHIQPHLVTHLRAHNPELEARLDYISDILWGREEYGAVSKALHRRKWREEYPPRAEKSSLDDFRQQLQEANLDPTIQSAVSPRFLLYVYQGYPGLLLVGIPVLVWCSAGTREHRQRPT